MLRGLTPDGNKFDKVTWTEAQSKRFDMFMHLDVNTEIYPVKGRKFTLAIPTTLYLDGTPDTGYHTLGKLCKISEDDPGRAYKGSVKGVKARGGLIKLVIGVVMNKPKIIHKSVTEHLVRMDNGVADLRKLSAIETTGVWLVIIHGMGGIGKITLAKVVFNQLLPRF
ncbi:hypothetical protein ACJRO7_000140 [Eucalyptus globulus]|uniref:NB-ARC domain-containing protein n=1 Tax=Eucalyptus globulus TaxID=34317 RepID=A0ABD3LMM3_EUCGL